MNTNLKQDHDPMLAEVTTHQGEKETFKANIQAPYGEVEIGLQIVDILKGILMTCSDCLLNSNTVENKLCHL